MILFAGLLVLAFAAYLNVAPSAAIDRPRPAAMSALSSWNPNVTCAADLVTIKDVLGSAYPHQSLSGSRYQHNATSGGIPLERSLSPPCTITNITGAVLSPFVQINGVSLYGYGVKTTDCSGWYSKQNGGHRYPGNQTFCTDAGQIITLGTTSGYMKIEIDRDWLGRGYCGPNVPSCNNETLGQEQSNGSISLDMQGFVFWEGPYHWELHPLTAWKLSNSPPPPPPNSPPSVDFSWSPTSGNTSTVFSFTAQVSDDHDSPDSVPVRWDWTGDGTWDTGWSTTKTASHTYSSAGNKTVVVQAIDSGGLTSNRSHQVQVTAPPPPPPPNNPPSVDFSWSPTSGDTGTVFTFTATASDDHDPPNTIQVRWDWTGDGTWDPPWSTTKTASHTFSSPGNYTVVVQAKDSGGLTASASHVIPVSSPPPPPNAPPSVDFTWTPTSGDTNTVFTFTAQVTDDHDPPNTIQVRCDWTGDGTWDTSWSTTKTASHTFGSPGTYTVVVQAKDSGVLTASASHMVSVTSPPPPPNGPPTVDFTWTPTSGDTSTVFTFTATASDDHDPPNTIQVRWDWTGDGTWDTAWSTTKTVSHTFSSAGTYTVVVQAIDSGGLTAIQSHTIIVTAPPPPGDFSISASPASLTIVCGSSGSSGITLTSLNGLSGTASLSASISSSGLVLVWPTVSLSPSSVTLPSGGTATSTLTVSTSVLTTPGTYTVTVTATIGSITHSADVTVVVTLM